MFWFAGFSWPSIYTVQFAYIESSRFFSQHITLEDSLSKLAFLEETTSRRQQQMGLPLNRENVPEGFQFHSKILDETPLT